MTRAAGRKCLWRCSAAAVVTMMAMSRPGVAAAPPADLYSPPQSAMLLSRTLVRALADGNTITTRRTYQLRIVPSAAGFEVDGQLVDVVVNAPPSLQALAQIERQRPDTGLFPLHLDPQGMIVGERAATPSPAIDRAIGMTSGRIDGAGLAPADISEAQAFTAQLQERRARSVWPRDLFRPVPGKRSETQALVLPGGQAGEMRIDIEGQGAGPAGQIAALSRVVTTDMGGDKRVTRELWQISRYVEISGR